MATEASSNPPAVTIGRDATNDVVCADRCVSRRHAQLVYRDAHWAVCDLGSANGTYVNDERIAQETPLTYGDRLRLARFGPEYIFPDDFHLPVPVPPPKRSPAAFRTRFSQTLVLVAKAARETGAAPPAPVASQPAPPPLPTPQQFIYEYFRRLAQLSPRSAVMDSWRILELAMRHRYHAVFKRRPSPSGCCNRDLINALRDKGILSPPDAEAIHHLRDLRNAAAHYTMFALTPAQADAYAVQVLSHAHRLHRDTFLNACDTVVLRNQQK